MDGPDLQDTKVWKSCNDWVGLWSELIRCTFWRYEKHICQRSDSLMPVCGSNLVWPVMKCGGVWFWWTRPGAPEILWCRNLDVLQTLMRHENERLWCPDHKYHSCPNKFIYLRLFFLRYGFVFCPIRLLALFILLSSCEIFVLLWHCNFLWINIVLSYLSLTSSGSTNHKVNIPRAAVYC